MMKWICFGILLMMLSCIGKAPLRRIELGKWGSTKHDQNTSLFISEQNLLFDFTCASATIEADFSNETRTSFSLSGIYFLQRPILPENYVIEKDKHDAIFDFVSSKNKLTVTIFDKTENQKIGVFIYQKGLERMVFKCL